MRCTKCNFENPTHSQFCNKCGTKIFAYEKEPTTTVPFYTPIHDLKPGAMFAGRYQILEEIGRGGMGKVYKVLDKEVNEKIAVKILRPEISVDEKTIERFRQELKLARKISHANVCRTYDLAKQNGIYFITMEYVSGEDLKSTIERLGQLSFGKILYVIKQICNGLAEAHRIGVIHRDLKPHNVMIDREGNVRIMDFGIARSISSPGITDSGVLVGTPEYMSPEQSLGEQVDQRSDIYSLGIILYELLTERLPFQADTSVGVALKQKSEPPPNPKSFNKEIPDDLNYLVLKCLEKDKNKRFQNVSEIIETIENIERALPTTEKVLPEKRTTKKVPSRKSAQLMVPLIFILMAIIIVIGILFMRERLPSKENMESAIPSTSDNKPVQTQEGISKTGSINIIVTPKDAEIFIDEEKIGPAPIVHELQAGFHAIRISKYPLFKETSEEIEIKPGDQVVREYELEPLYVVEVETKPESATVRVDGKFYGKTGTNPMKIESTVGTFQLDIDMGEEWEWIPFSRKVTLEQGLNSLISHSFTKKKYKLIITTEPSDALVYLWEKEQGRSPKELSLIAGLHKIRIAKDGYEPEKDTFTLKKDDIRNYTLTPLRKGQFKLIVFPIAQVFVDGESIGEVSKMATFSLPAGKHKLEFVSKELGKFIHHIEISVDMIKTFHMNMETGDLKEIKNNQQGGKL